MQVKINKRLLRLLASIICVFVLLNGCVPHIDEQPVPAPTAEPSPDAVSASETWSAAQSVQEYPPGERARGYVKLSDMEYEGYDETEFLDAAERICELVDEPDAMGEISALYKYLYDELFMIDAQTSLAYIEHCLHASDESLSEAYSRMEEICIECDDTLRTALAEALSSDYAASVRKLIGAELTDELDEWEGLSDRARELLREESRLIQEYERQSVYEYSVERYGELWTFDALANDTALTTERYIDVRDELFKLKNEAEGKLFLELLDVRRELAHEYGFETYSEYAYKETYNRDFSATLAASFCDEVKESVSPRYFQSMSEIVDIYYSANPSFTPDELMNIVKTYSSEISPTLREPFEYMEKLGLILIGNDEDMLDAQFSSSIASTNAPYIFIYAYGGATDLDSLIHEFGHAASSYNHGSKNIMVKKSTFDLAEIHSQGLECLFAHYYGEIYGPDADNAEKKLLYRMISAMVEGCIQDEFQRELYSSDEALTLEDVNALYKRVRERYGEWYGRNVSLDMTWVQIPHTFTSPMYYISYATSALSSLDIWSRSLDDYDKAVETYLAVVSHGLDDTGYLETLALCGMESFESPGYTQRIAGAALDAVFG